MPSTHIARTARRIAALGSLAALLAPAAAHAACPASAASKAFSQYGDGAGYVLAPGGAFQSGAPGWTLAGAHVSGEALGSALVPGSHAVVIGMFGHASSPWVCVSAEYPTFRVLAAKLGGWGQLNVSVEWLSLLGILGAGTPVASLEGSGSWAPSPVMNLSSAVPLQGTPLEGLFGNVRLVFQATGTSSWAISDVFIDPYRR